MACLTLRLAIATAALLLGALSPAHAAQDCSDFVPWVAGESYEGRSQADPRLDQSVHLWGAGMSMPNVCATVREQTGVEIGFWPPRDENERICVNLYLNRTDPPALRELMVQLAWILDCSFGVTENSGEKRYVLLRTSMAGGTWDRMAGERDERIEEGRRAMRAEMPDHRQELAEKMAEIREALLLSESGLIARYRGIDEVLLLALLEPRRRGVLEFVTGLPEADLAELQGRQSLLQRRWSQWSPEQRRWLGSLFEQSRRAWSSEDYLRRLNAGEIAWEDELPLQVVIDFRPSSGTLRLRADRLEADESGLPSYLTAGGVRLMGTLRDEPDDVADLEEALGEPLTPAEREALWEDYEQAQQKRSADRRKESAERVVRRRLSEQEALSSYMVQRLSSFELPSAFEDPVSLWQVQAALAERSGLHVVSDCFWQPRVDLSALADLGYGGDIAQLTGYEASCLSAASTVDWDRLSWWRPDDHTAGWEWGSAGKFLRYRHRARDLWRAAFLPTDMLASVDHWLDPCVQSLMESDDGTGQVKVDVSLRQASEIAGRLSSPQLSYGGRITYGAPLDPETAFRHQIRETVLTELARSGEGLRLLATFSDGQWELLESGRLRWNEDLTAVQKESLFWNGLGPPRDRREPTVIDLRAGGEPRSRSGFGRGVIETHGIFLAYAAADRPGGRPRSGDRGRRSESKGHLYHQFPKTIVVHTERPNRLLEGDSAPDAMITSTGVSEGHSNNPR